MASSSKSSNIGLNQWISSDKPEMKDFNNDNSILDKILGNHVDDLNIHLGANERIRWNNPYSVARYTGDGTAIRKVGLNFDFQSNFCVVFGKDVLPVQNDSLTGKTKHYFGIASKNASTQGLIIDGSVLTVYQRESDGNPMDLLCFNEKNVQYTVIGFR